MDTYTAGEVLADQPGPGVVTFTFSAPVVAVVLRVAGGEGRVDPFGGEPEEGFGIPLPDGEPTTLPMSTDRVSVYLPAGVTAVAWGYR